MGELAFVHYRRVLEEHYPGVPTRAEFSHLSLAERQGWIEAAKAVAEDAAISDVPKAAPFGKPKSPARSPLNQSAAAACEERFLESSW